MKVVSEFSVKAGGGRVLFYWSSPGMDGQGHKTVLELGDWILLLDYKDYFHSSWHCLGTPSCGWPGLESPYFPDKHYNATLSSVPFNPTVLFLDVLCFSTFLHTFSKPGQSRECNTMYCHGNNTNSLHHNHFWNATFVFTTLILRFLFLLTH